MDIPGLSTTVRVDHAGARPSQRERQQAGEQALRLAPRVRQLIESQSYVQADEDAAFLRRPEMCGVRLQLDYWKTEERLQQLGIAHTVVVYGSTRVTSPARARRRLATARRLAQADTGAQAQRELRVAQALLRRSIYYDVARKLGALIGHARGTGKLPRLTVVTGGGPGVMEAANRGAFDAGAPTVGMNITLPKEQYPNPYLTPELCFRFHYFAIRKLHLLERAKAAVFFPGGYGTCDELFEVLTLLQTGKIAPFPVLLVGETWWRSVIDFDAMAEAGMIDPDDLALFRFCESAEEVWAAIRNWYGDGD
ncbi:LOG family protein [Paraburkholderia guartelaensis]|uniref:LOG family protein n=1 Tax=Paraburkholderia guartelaensis TaxID=2546446 RepID=UPI002AB6AA14|nr:LOG family protein [Paraburkholderia guartelaensis]